MITRTRAQRATLDAIDSNSTAPAWRRALRDAVGDLHELLALLDLTPEQVGASESAAGQFPLRVPRGFVSRMKPRDPHDPLLLQVLPGRRELQGRPGYSSDPLDEERFTPVPGLLHKYQGRALLVTTGACAIHCRYCFRRHFPYGEHAGDLEPALEYVARDPSIHELILSGGDPLSLSDRKLADLAERAARIPHLRRLRLHTRLPIVLPQRVDEHLLAWLSRARIQTVVVVHCNHGNELDEETVQALLKIKATGTTLLNQTVLLRDINDHADTLIYLSEALFQAGVLPYYLHILDRVDGAAHFEVPEADAKRIARRLLSTLPGYLVPKLVREEPGAPSKTPVSPFGA